jgi:PleD family two-component response regulator
MPIRLLPDQGFPQNRRGFSHAHKSVIPACEQAGSATPPPKSRGETVLLVEDDLAILANTQKILNRLGYTVMTASTPSEAILLAESLDVDPQDTGLKKPIKQTFG